MCNKLEINKEIEKRIKALEGQQSKFSFKEKEFDGLKKLFKKNLERIEWLEELRREGLQEHIDWSEKMLEIDAALLTDEQVEHVRVSIRSSKKKLERLSAPPYKVVCSHFYRSQDGEIFCSLTSCKYPDQECEVKLRTLIIKTKGTKRGDSNSVN